MNQLLQWIIPIIVGSAIGYITNVIAIKMIFRPYKKKEIFKKLPIPFTPGILPKQRYKLATQIGALVERELLSEDVLKAKLKAPETCAYFAKVLMDNFSENFPFPFERLCNSLAKKTLDYISTKIPSLMEAVDISKTVEDRINSLEMQKVESMVIEIVKTQLQWINIFGGMLGGLIGLVQALLNNLIW